MRRLMLIIALAFGAAACGHSLGSGCKDNKDCSEIPDGYCAITGICVATCSQVGAVCGAEAGTCASAFGQTVCLPSCHAQGECRTGEGCLAVTSSSSACVIVDVTARP